MSCHQRQLMPKSKTRRKVRKSQRVQTLRENLAVESLILSMLMATKFDQRKKIKKLAKNKRNQKNNLAKNFLLTNFNLIAKNNLNF
jgi:delta-aminolevulinic acid dehydratase/porphobilinogen synthase